MKHGSNPRRARSRGNGKRPPSRGSNSFESSGPETKIRGSAQQVHDKYLALARDAGSADDRIAAESYLQYADHYYRIIQEQRNAQEQRNVSRNAQARGGRDRHQGSKPEAVPEAPSSKEDRKREEKDAAPDSSADTARADQD